jgi:hypothetical protein
MKKLIYIILIAFVSSMTITSCTEDEVKPTEEGTEGGHDEGDPIN